jgi:methylated-DNA-protein-cysteine methyltransferase related protein
MADSIEEAKELVWQIVHAIPVGRVATYGQVAALAGMPQKSRLVGRVLSRLPNGTKLP